MTWDLHKTSTKRVTVSVWEIAIKMNGVTDPLRFIKFAEKTTNFNTNRSKYNQMYITTAHYIALKTLYKIIHTRWGIEKNIFCQLKTERHMNHCFIHHKKWP
jgi:hypothetical protein